MTIEIMHNRKIIFMLLVLCTIHSKNIFSSENAINWIDNTEFISKNAGDVFSIIQGSYESVSIQGGWSLAKAYKGHQIKIYKDGKIEYYNSEIKNDAKYVLICSFYMKLSNSNGYISAEIRKSTIKYIENGGDLNLSDSDINWLKGHLYISNDYKTIMFGNNIEIDGGPAITWKKN